MKSFALAIMLILFSVVTVFADPEALPESTQAANGGTISGQVMINKKTPMKNGVVLLFNEASGPPPSFDKYWRIPDMMVATDKKGHFSISIESGTYYLQVAQKDPKGDIGPVQTDEYLYFHGDKKYIPLPLVVTSKNIKLGKLVAKKFPVSREKFDKGVTLIEGTVSEMNGNPVENMVVFAHLSEQMRGRPTFVSNKTNKNGVFTLRVVEGTYFLKARTKIGGGPPKSGELQNVIGDSEPLQITVKNEQKLKGIILKVENFTGKGEAETSTATTAEKVWENIPKSQGK